MLLVKVSHRRSHSTERWSRCPCMTFFCNAFDARLLTFESTLRGWSQPIDKLRCYLEELIYGVCIIGSNRQKYAPDVNRKLAINLSRNDDLEKRTKTPKLKIYDCRTYRRRWFWRHLSNHIEEATASSHQNTQCFPHIIYNK